jgi:3-dehydroquinate synthase
MSWRIDLSSTARRSTILGGAGSIGVLEERAASLRRTGSRFFVITDVNVSAACGDRVVELLGAGVRKDVLTMPAGEATKTVASAAVCWEWLAARGARRGDCVVALGGGVVGDLAGFVASTHLRGMPLWQIPTSLLAQVDSSVGGKTAVNLETGKNLVGSFYQPDLVVVDPELLGTLSAPEFVNGLGEVVKCALLDDSDLLESLETQSALVRCRDFRTIERLVERCVIYKAAVVEDDEREKGRRAVLNLGHTTAHALEVALGYGVLSHGRAVALGLLVALAVSETMFDLPADVRKRTEGLLLSLDLPTRAELVAVSTLLDAASRDKKVSAGTSGFVCLKALGRPVWGVDVTREVLEAALEVIRL